MRPFTIYQHMEGQQEKLVSLIGQVIKPSSIYLLGASLYRRRSESVFCPIAPTSQHVSDYYFLVLLADTQNRPLSDWRDRIEQHCAAIMPVTVIVMETKTFADWIISGHRFARTVLQQSVPLYATEKDNPLPPIPGNYDAATERKMIAKQHREGLDKARGFLAGAELFGLRKEMKLSTFMLHQSVEQALQTILVTGTGFHYCTHNINRLIRYAGLASYQLSDIFPRNNENEKRLFSILQKAYIEARYGQDFSVQGQDLILLSERVKRLHDLLEEYAQTMLQTG